jgi:hypothetical protein
MDATVELRTADTYKVQGYPMLKLFKAPSESAAETTAETATESAAKTAEGGKNKNETVFDYRGARTANGIINWLERKTGPPCPVVTTKAHLEGLVASADVVVVGFFDDASSEGGRMFEAAAIEDETNRYVFAQGDELRTAYGVVGDENSVILLKTFDEGEVRLTKELTKENLEHFVWLEGRPVAFEFSPRTAEAIFGSGIHRHLLFLARKSDKNHHQYMETVMALRYMSLLVLYA